MLPSTLRGRSPSAHAQAASAVRMRPAARWQCRSQPGRRTSTLRGHVTTTPPQGDHAVLLWNGDATELRRWTSMAADGSRATLSAEPCRGGGSAMRLDYHLAGPTSWAIARRNVHADLPEHYVVVMRIRGVADPNQL